MINPFEVTSTQRAAARASNPNAARLNELDLQLDALDDKLDEYKQHINEWKWALMKERSPLLSDTERALNLFSYMDRHGKEVTWAKALSTNDLCEWLMNQDIGSTTKVETALSEVYERAGYVYEEESTVSRSDTVITQ